MIGYLKDRDVNNFFILSDARVQLKLRNVEL